MEKIALQNLLRLYGRDIYVTKKKHFGFICIQKFVGILNKCWCKSLNKTKIISLLNAKVKLRVCPCDVSELHISGSCQSSSGGDNLVGHVHDPGQYPELSPSCGLHQGHWRVVRSLCRVCLLCSSRICSCQLCLKVNRFYEEILSEWQHFSIIFAINRLF